MKVLFVVSSMTRKQGGHFYSLLSTAKAVSTTASVKIISVGRYKVALFKDGGVDYIHIRTSIGFFRALFTLTKEVKTWHPDVMHSFDVRSFFFARLVSLFTGTPCVQNKCGGPPPKYYPKAQNIILYSKEDVAWFNSSRRHRCSRVFYLPNRVQNPAPDKSCVQDLEAGLPSGRRKILRVCRIGPAYERSILLGIDLVRMLSKSGVPSCLVLIGVVQDKDVLKRIEMYAGKDYGVTFFVYTEPALTTNASRLLGLGDAIVASGRGAMEAASQGRFVLCESANLNTLILLRPDNIELFFYRNFSPRARFLGNGKQEEFELIRETLRGGREESYAEWIKRFARDNFVVDAVVEDILDIYRKSSPQSFHPIDVFANYLSLVKAFKRTERTKVNGSSDS